MDHSHISPRGPGKWLSLRRISALIVGVVVIVVLGAAAILVRDGSGFLETEHLGSLRGIWLWVGGVIAAILCIGAFLHSMRGLRIGRPRFTQQEPGILAFDPWTRRASLNASLRWRNANPELPLQLTSVEIVRYRLDGVATNERIVGRMLSRPTLLEPQVEGKTTMLFTLPATRSPSEASAEVVLRDELGRRHRTEVSFESPTFSAQRSIKPGSMR
jgi:hypothetical protein